MGMFDTVHINAKQLPVSPRDRKRLRGKDFQTKSGEKTLSDLYITEDGYLDQQITDFLWDTEAPGYQPPKRMRLVDVHGTMLFYTWVGKGKIKEPFEFKATFTKGRLTELKRHMIEEVDWHGHATLCWTEEQVASSD